MKGAQKAMSKPQNPGPPELAEAAVLSSIKGLVETFTKAGESYARQADRDPAMESHFRGKAWAFFEAADEARRCLDSTTISQPHEE